MADDQFSRSKLTPTRSEHSERLLEEAVRVIREWEDSDDLAYDLAEKMHFIFTGHSGPIV